MAGETVRFKVDSKAVISMLDRMHKEAPFAASVALNRTADEVQQAIRRTLPERFTLRRKDFVEKTIKIENRDRATKAKPSVRVAVDESRDFLAKFEEGGTKRPRDGKALSIPQGGIRRNKSDIIPKGQRVRALLASGKAFIKGGSVFQSIGRGKRRRPILAYVFKPSVKIPKLLGFEATARKVIDERFGPNMVGALDKLKAGTFQQGKRP